MRALASRTRLAVRLAPRLRHYQPLRILDEIWNNLRKETDFRQEARNIRRFAAAFADWPTPPLRLPFGSLCGWSAGFLGQDDCEGRWASYLAGLQRLTFALALQLREVTVSL